MMPAGPLMKEHRLIERMIAVMRRRVERMTQGAKVEPAFIDATVEFFSAYADRCHHGKEEDILFRALADKALSDAHRETMNTLVQQHVYARKQVALLGLNKELVLKDDPAGARGIIAAARELAEFYPRHIALEDKEFFLPVMAYLSKDEQAAMLERFTEFDASLVHERYRGIVEAQEKTQ